MDYWRQTDIVDARKLRDLTVTLFGCGGIGSPTAICLAKMGVGTLNIYDDDEIEEHNLPSTMFEECYIGRLKVVALYDMIEHFNSDVRVIQHAERPSIGTGLGGLCVSGVDSMKSRKDIWGLIKDKADLYIDARMGGQTAQIITVKPYVPSQAAFYESRLVDDSEVEDAPCTSRAIIYNTFMIASLICSQVKRFVMDEEIPRETFFDFVNYDLLARVK